MPEWPRAEEVKRGKSNHVHNRPHSGIPHRQLTLPTVEEVGKIVEYQKQAKDEVDALTKQFKQLEAKL